MKILVIIMIIMGVIISWDQVIILKLRSDRNKFRDLYNEALKQTKNDQTNIDNDIKKVSRDITKF